VLGEFLDLRETKHQEDGEYFRVGSHLNIITVVKSRRIRKAIYLGRIREKRSAYTVLVG
jgi:hypothetical protein